MKAKLWTYNFVLSVMNTSFWIIPCSSHKGSRLFLQPFYVILTVKSKWTEVVFSHIKEREKERKKTNLVYKE